MDDDYNNVQRGSLKLKGDLGIKKKKNKKSKEKNLKEAIKTTNKQISEEANESNYIDGRTKAELAYEKYQKEKAAERILKKATLSHKEKIIKLNSHLDSLTEHFDMPKLSWTK